MVRILNGGKYYKNGAKELYTHCTLVKITDKIYPVTGRCWEFKQVQEYCDGSSM